MPSKKHEKSNGNGSGRHRAEPVVATGLAHYDSLKKLLDQASLESSDNQARRDAWAGFNNGWCEQSALEREGFAEALYEAGIDERLLTRFKLDHDIISLLVSDLNFRPIHSNVASIEIELLKSLIQKRSESFSDGEDSLLSQARKAGVDFSASERWKAGGSRTTHRVREPDLWVMHLSSKAETEDMRTRERERDEYGRFMPEHDDDRPMRGQHRDRDEYGRFTSDDDDRRSRSSRGSNYRDRDEYGRFVSDDDDHRYGMRGSNRRQHDDDDDYRRSRSSRSDYDDRRRGRSGWYGDSERHSEAARRGWDNPDHGPSGWYGDRERHSRAAREGWDNPDHGPSGWYGDSEGHSRAARRGWDNPDHGPSGWYGDSEGHSRASRRGWDDRRSSDRYYDDDRPRGGSRRRD